MIGVLSSFFRFLPSPSPWTDGVLLECTGNIRWFCRGTCGAAVYTSSLRISVGPKDADLPCAVRVSSQGDSDRSMRPCVLFLTSHHAAAVAFVFVGCDSTQVGMGNYTGVVALGPSRQRGYSQVP